MGMPVFCLSTPLFRTPKYKIVGDPLIVGVGVVARAVAAVTAANGMEFLCETCMSLLHA
jgi:hypothetical protein